MGEQRCIRCGALYKKYSTTFTDECQKCVDEIKHQKKMEKFAKEQIELIEKNNQRNRQNFEVDNENDPDESNEDIEESEERKLEVQRNEIEALEKTEDEFAAAAIEKNQIIVGQQMNDSLWTLEGLKLTYPGKSVDPFLSVINDDFENRSIVNLYWNPIISRAGKDPSTDDFYSVGRADTDMHDHGLGQEIYLNPSMKCSMKYILCKNNLEDGINCIIFVIRSYPGQTNLRAGKIIIDTGSDKIHLLPFSGERKTLEEKIINNKITRKYLELALFAIDRTIIDKIASSNTIKYKIYCAKESYIETNQCLLHFFRVVYNQLFDQNKYMESLDYAKNEIKDYIGKLKAIIEKQKKAVIVNKAVKVDMETANARVIENKVINSETVTDIDGNVYHTVTIGKQIWMVENLKTTKYNDGTEIWLIPEGETVPKREGFCWWMDNETDKEFGALYNWYAVNTGKLAPIGWHVPTDSDWNVLIEYLGGEDVAGGALKKIGMIENEFGLLNIGAANTSSFSALLGGCRSDRSGEFVDMWNYGYWWSSTAIDASNAWCRDMHVTDTAVGRENRIGNGGCLSVRCLKDN